MEKIRTMYLQDIISSVKLKDALAVLPTFIS